MYFPSIKNNQIAAISCDVICNTINHTREIIDGKSARNLHGGGCFVVHGVRRMMLAEPSGWKGILCSSEWQGSAVQGAEFS